MAAAVSVDIEGEIDSAWAIAQLLKLASVQMRAHLGGLLNLLSGIQATLRSREEAMSENGSDTAAVEVDDVSALAVREADAPVEGIAALWVE